MTQLLPVQYRQRAYHRRVLRADGAGPFPHSQPEQHHQFHPVGRKFVVIGGYIAYAIAPYIGFWGALLLAPPLTALIGLAVERVLIRPLYGRDPLYSLLLTFGLAFIIEDGTRFIFGPQGKPVIHSAVSSAAFEQE